MADLTNFRMEFTKLIKILVWITLDLSMSSKENVRKKMDMSDDLSHNDGRVS